MKRPRFCIISHIQRSICKILPEKGVFFFQWRVSFILPFACEQVGRTSLILIFIMENTRWYSGFCCEKAKTVDVIILTGIYNNISHDHNSQKHSLLYVLIKVPPRTSLENSRWHCSIALRWVNWLNVRTVCVELIVFDTDVSFTGLLFSVQETLLGRHDVSHMISALDPLSINRSLGTTLQMPLWKPAGKDFEQYIVIHTMPLDCWDFKSEVHP